MSELRPSPQLEYASPGTVRPPRRFPWWIAVGALLAVGASILLLPSSNSRRGALSPRVKCANNLRQIGLACLMYANAHGNSYPDTLGQVLLEEDITSDVFVCPSTSDTPARGATTQAVVANLTTGHHLSYIYVGKGLKSDAGSDVIVAYEPLTNHGGAGMEVLYADGHVEWHDAKAGRIVAELQSGHNPPRPVGAASAGGK